MVDTNADALRDHLPPRDEREAERLARKMVPTLGAVVEAIGFGVLAAIAPALVVPEPHPPVWFGPVALSLFTATVFAVVWRTSARRERATRLLWERTPLEAHVFTSKVCSLLGRKRLLLRAAFQAGERAIHAGFFVAVRTGEPITTLPVLYDRKTRSCVAIIDGKLVLGSARRADRPVRA